MALNLNLFFICKKVSNRSTQNVFKQQVRYFKTKPQKIETRIDPPAKPINVNGNSNPIEIRSIWKSLAFTISFSTASLAGTAIWEYENCRAAILTSRNPIEFFKNKLDEGNIHIGEFRNQFNNFWHDLTDGEKIFSSICFINVMVFFAWRVPALQPTMQKYFLSNPFSKIVCLPMILSVFSHYSLIHLLSNMYVLHSFSSVAVTILGKEQFLGMYLTAGVVSSFVSNLVKFVTKMPGNSLGASGAIMAILAYVCTKYPENKLGIVFIPNITFSADSAIKSLLAFDLIGVLFRWKFFDHGAHLGGAVFGIFWAYYGNSLIWKNKTVLIEYWHQFRGPLPKK